MSRHKNMVPSATAKRPATGLSKWAQTILGWCALPSSIYALWITSMHTSPRIPFASFGCSQAAIRDAAASPRGGVVYVPPGSFLLNYPLYVNVTRVIIRGAGPTRSTLLFGRSLGQIYKGSWKVDACSGGPPGLQRREGQGVHVQRCRACRHCPAHAWPGDGAISR